MSLWNVWFLFWNVPLLSTYNIYILELVMIMTIGNRIRELRISKNMSQKELSELIDVSKSAISIFVFKLLWQKPLMLQLIIL